MAKRIVFIDMDDTIVDFKSGIDVIKEYAEYRHKDPNSFNENWDEVPGIFSHMKPIEGAIDAVSKLADHFEVHILTTAPWLNPSAWADKLTWIHNHFGDHEEAVFHKKVTVSHNKQLLRGDYLIDDRYQNGAGEFGNIEGQTWIKLDDKPNNPRFSPVECADWATVLAFSRFLKFKEELIK